MTKVPDEVWFTNRCEFFRDTNESDNLQLFRLLNSTFGDDVYMVHAKETEHVLTEMRADAKKG